jgi:agarase
MRFFSILLAAILLPGPSADPAFCDVTIKLDPRSRLFIGGTVRFERDQFLLIHGSPDELPEEQVELMLEKTNASLARSVNLLSHEFRKVSADPLRPGHKSLSRLEAVLDAMIKRDGIDGGPRWANVGLSMHPQDLIRKNPAHEEQVWGGDSDEGRAEAMLRSLQMLQAAGWTVPFFEPMNEPRTKLEMMGVDWPRIIEFHRNVLPKLRADFPGAKIGGYAAYDIRFNRDDFANWRSFPQRYLDEVGDPGDFFSFHPYAYTPMKGRMRDAMAGSVLEATLDLISAYTTSKFGKPLPLYVSEYGLAWIEGKHSLFHLYTPRRDWEIMREINGQLFSYLQRPDVVIRAIPFIVPYWEWWRRSPDSTPETPHSPWALFHEIDGKYVPTHLFKFYELWSDVRGEYVWASSSDPGVPCVAIRNDGVLWIALHNHASAPRTVVLKSADPEERGLLPDSGTAKSLFIGEDVPILRISEAVFLAKPIELRPYETLIVRCELGHSSGDAPSVVHRETFYGPDTLIEIGQEPVKTRVRGLDGKKPLAASLRLSMSGKPAVPTPTLAFNGRIIPVPEEEVGDGPQTQSGEHWSVRLVSLPTELIKEENEIVLNFPTPGGRVSSVALVIDHATRTRKPE